MGLFDSLFGWGGEDPVAVRQREEGYRRQADERAARAAAEQQNAQIAYLNQIRADDLAREAELKAKDPTALRQSAMSTLESYFTPEFEQGLVPGTITDPLEQSVYGEQFAGAQELIDRMFKRGVLAAPGKEAAYGELEKQAPRVRTQLDQIGQALLEAERGKQTGFAGRAKERASALNVGESFDLTPYSKASQESLGAFQTGLSDLFKSQVPTDLFDTSALAAIGGGVQGAGAEPLNKEGFVPTEDDEVKDPFTGQKPVQKRTTSVF